MAMISSMYLSATCLASIASLFVSLVASVVVVVVVVVVADGERPNFTKSGLNVIFV